MIIHTHLPTIGIAFALAFNAFYAISGMTTTDEMIINHQNEVYQRLKQPISHRTGGVMIDKRFRTSWISPGTITPTNNFIFTLVDPSLNDLATYYTLFSHRSINIDSNIDLDVEIPGTIQIDNSNSETVIQNRILELIAPAGYFIRTDFGNDVLRTTNQINEEP